MLNKVTLKDLGNAKRTTILTTRGEIALHQIITLDGMEFVVFKNDRKVGKPTKSINRALSVFNKTMEQTYKKRA